MDSSVRRLEVSPPVGNGAVPLPNKFRAAVEAETLVEAAVSSVTRNILLKFISVVKYGVSLESKEKL